MSASLAGRVLRAVGLALRALALAGIWLALRRWFIDRRSLMEFFGVFAWPCLAALGACGWLAWRSARAAIRAPVGRAVDVRWAAIVFTLGTVVVLQFLQPVRAVWLEFAAGFAGGAFALCTELERRWSERRTWRVAEYLALNLALVPWIVEGGARLVRRWHPSPVFAAADGGPERYVAAYRFKPGDVLFRFPCDSRGFLDEELASDWGGKLRVACIGDSFSTGVVPHPCHYTCVAERALGDTQIYNISVPAVGPPEYRFLLEHDALPLAPEVVVIAIFVGNDISFYDSRSPAPSTWFQSCFARDNWISWIALERWSNLRREAQLRGGAAAKVQGAQELGDSPVLTVDDAEREYPWLTDPALEKPTFSEQAFSAMERARAVDVCGADERFYPPFFACLREIRECAGQLPTFVLLIPDEFQVDDQVWRDVEAGFAPGALERDKPQRLIVPELTQMQIQVIDLLPRLRALGKCDDGRPHAYHVRDTHFNARGNRVAGEALAEALQPTLAALRSKRRQ